MAASAPIVFGPEDQQWQYTQSTKNYDISYGSARKMTIATSEGSIGTSFTVDPASSALVIVDMQNFFLDAQCMDHPNGLKAIEPTIALIEKCRKVGIQVVWLNWGLTDADMSVMPAGVQRGFLRDIIQSTPLSAPRRPYSGLGSDLGGSKGRVLFASSWNADIYPALKAYVQEDDVHCAKNRMSGLWTPEQPLWKEMKAREKTTLFFTGVNTDQCVLGTLVDGYNAGWNCVLVDDCCGTPTPGGRDVTVWNVSRSFGFVTKTANIVAAQSL
ncbi:isochorismatase [Xylogone sp. PMI_703]|nr:isochorismatase [Xylogone sp. PMI_703]